ncbi:MAG: ABC transporter ATP-binding protein/permease [bacterium]|nr:ABC transporter ATP-binding protein/permease [bacterium]
MSKVQQALAPDEIQSAQRRLDFSLLRRLWKYIRPYRRAAGVTLLLTLAAGGLNVTLPLMAKRIIDVEIARGNMTGVVHMSLLYLTVIVLAVGLDVAFNYLSAWVGQHAMHDLRLDLYRHVLGQDVVYFDRNPVGRIITRLTSDVGTLNELFATGVVSTTGDMLVLLGVVGLMLYHSLYLSMVLLLVIPIMVPAISIFRRYSRRWYLETRRHLATLNAYLQENLAGIRTVQAFNREGRNFAQFRLLNRDYREANIKTILAFAMFFPVMSLVSSGAVAGVIWVGGGQIIAGRLSGAPTLTFGELFLFIQCMQMLFSPIRTLTEKINLLQSATASSERIFKLLDTRPAIMPPVDPVPVPPLREAVRFEHVDFAYVEGEPVLRDVSFDIPRGQTIAVVGATGAGKSTLINLMTRFYDVGGGRILLDGVDLRRFDPGELRRMFAVVLQEVFLFSGTIAENLRLANPSLSDAQLWDILRQVNAHDFVAGLPGGLRAKVTERGGTFSTGQKQLLAFARALAADPQVLVLDEATANIDTETEQRIQAAIRRMLAGRTGLVIAHRLSTIQRADRILVMHRGRVRESGTHEELLQLDGLYRRLFELQYRQPPAGEVQPAGTLGGRPEP